MRWLSGEGVEGGGAAQQGRGFPVSASTGWPWGGKVTGTVRSPHHEGEKYCSLDVSFCHSPAWPGVHPNEGKVGYLFLNKGDISVQFNRDEDHPPKKLKLVPQSPDADCSVLATWAASSQG